MLQKVMICLMCKEGKRKFAFCKIAHTVTCVGLVMMMERMERENENEKQVRDDRLGFMK